jgi:hypothetical protein
LLAEKVSETELSGAANGLKAADAQLIASKMMSMPLGGPRSFMKAPPLTMQMLGPGAPSLPAPPIAKAKGKAKAAKNGGAPKPSVSKAKSKADNLVTSFKQLQKLLSVIKTITAQRDELHNRPNGEGVAFATMIDGHREAMTKAYELLRAELSNIPPLKEHVWGL